MFFSFVVRGTLPRLNIGRWTDAVSVWRLRWKAFVGVDDDDVVVAFFWCLLVEKKKKDDRTVQND
jgi:hypothetical protein